MRTHRHEFVLASLLALAACDARESHAGASQPKPEVPAPESERNLAPTPAPTPAPVPVAPVVPERDEAQSEPSAVPELPVPVDASADVLAQALARVETRAAELRKLAGDLGSAVEALGENATVEQRAGATAVGELLSALEGQLTQLRSAAAADVVHLEGAVNEAADALERRAAELKALIP